MKITYSKERPPVDPEFTAMVERNKWHDDLPRFIGHLIRMKNEGWSWARNWPYKYITVRIDMRDLGFVILRDADKATGEPKTRCSPEEIAWQYRSDPKESQ